MAEKEKTKLSKWKIAAVVLLVIFIIFAFLQYREFSRSRIELLESYQLEQLKSDFRFRAEGPVTREAALDSLLQAEEEIAELAVYKLPTLFFRDTMLIAKRYFIGPDLTLLEDDIATRESGVKKTYLESLREIAKQTVEQDIKPLNYTEVARLTQFILFKKKQALVLLDAIDVFKEKEATYKSQGLKTEEALEGFNKAETAFDQERYSDAASLLLEADAKLDAVFEESRREKSVIASSRNFLIRYWPLVVLVVAAIILITPPIFRKTRRRAAAKKLESLKAEMDTINNLIKEAQKECFQTKTITIGTYRVREEKYKTRLAEIKRKIPVLEAIVRGEKAPEEKPKEKKPKQGILQIEDEEVK